MGNGDSRNLKFGRGARLDALTSLRFFAAFAIVLHHSKGVLLPEEALGGWPLGQGVSLFFVLSGFILVHVYRELPTTESVRDFWLARIGRIWPAHLVGLLLVLIVSGRATLGGDSLVIFLANVFMIHAWIPSREYFFSFNALSWTISTELGFYALFPLLIFKFRETWMWKLLAAGGVLVGLMVICTLWSIPDYSATDNGVTNFSLLYISPLGRLFEFVLGMCTALWWHRIRPRLGSNLLVWTIAEVVVFAGALWSVRYGTWHLIQMARSSVLPVAQQWLIHAAPCLSFAALIAVSASGSGLIGRMLSLAPLVFLGEISYGIYMLHQVMIGAYAKYRLWLSPVPRELEFPGFVVVLLITTTLVYVFIEQPLRTRIRALGALRAHRTHVLRDTLARVVAAWSPAESAAGSVRTPTAPGPGTAKGFEERWALPTLFAVVLAVHVFLAFQGWNNAFGEYSFRQSQTAISTYFLAKDGLRLDYPTPVLGPPWSIPLEFPTFQFLVATVVRLTGCPLEQTGQLISLVFFYLTLIQVWSLLALIHVRPGHRWLVLILLLTSPIYIYWSRNFMLESTALFFSVGHLNWAIRAVRQPTARALGWTAAFGTLAGLTKITTWAASALLVGAYVLYAAWSRAGRDQAPDASGRMHRASRALASVLPVGLVGLALPAALALWWSDYAETVRAQNPLAKDFLLLGQLHGWNFGTWKQRLSIAHWLTVFQGSWLNSFGWACVLLPLLPVWAIHVKTPRIRFALLLILTGFAGPLVFFNLYVVHNYYHYATAIYFTLAAGLLIVGVLEQTKRSFAVGLVVVLIAASSYHRYATTWLIAQCADQLTPYFGQVVQRVTQPEDVLLIVGHDWDSTVAFYSRRQAIMSRKGMDDPAMQKSLQLLSRPPAALIAPRPLVDANPAMWQGVIQRFNLSSLPLSFEHWNLYVANQPESLPAALRSARWEDQPLNAAGLVEGAVSMGDSIVVFGWARRPDSLLPADFVVITTETHEVVLIAPTGIPRADVGRFFHTSNLDHAGFSGALNAATLAQSGATEVRAYGISTGRKGVYRLPGTFAVRREPGKPLALVKQ